MLTISTGAFTKLTNNLNSPLKLCGSAYKNVSTINSITKYFGKFECEQNLKLFRSYYLRRSTKKLPQELYCGIDSEANKIAEAIGRHRNRNVPLIEVYPGPGVITKYLVNGNDGRLLLFDSNNNFLDASQCSTMLQKEENQSYLDRQSLDFWHYDTSQNFIRPFATSKWEDDIIAQVIITSTSSAFIRDIFRQIIFRSGIFAKGRIEFFAVLPALEYIKLTSRPDSAYFLYMAKSCIFQILFEYEYLLKIDRRAFLPWASPKVKKLPKLVSSIETDYLYLIRMVPRRDLFSYGDDFDIQALYFLIDQCLIKRKRWILPKLEKWFPGCGSKIICTSSPANPAPLLTTSIDLADLPEYTRPCMQLSVKDNFPSIHTFTESGELTPEQMFSLFHHLKQLPAYQDSTFSEVVAEYYMKLIVGKS